MDHQAKKPYQEMDAKDVQTAEMNAAEIMRAVHGNAADALNALSVDELRKRSDSMIENIGALRFAIARIESLDSRRMQLEVGLAEAIKTLRTLPDLAPYQQAYAVLHGD